MLEQEEPEYWDIFISHAWNDGRSMDREHPARWICTFRDLLLEELRKIIPWKVNVFVDESAIRSGPIPLKIRSAINRSLIFLNLYSQEYVASGYCPEELDLFRTTGIPLPAMDRESRIIPVLLDPPAMTRMVPLRGLKYWDFYEYLNAARTQWQKLPLDEGRNGKSRIRDVAGAVGDVLRSLYGKGGDLFGRKGAAYVSSTDDISGQRTSICQHLEYHGFAVLPDSALPDNARAFKAEVGKCMERSTLSVHAIGATFRPPRSMQFIKPYKEFLLALSGCIRGNPAAALAWMPKSELITNRRNLRFVNWCRKIANQKAALASKFREFDSDDFHVFKERIDEATRSLNAAPRWTPPKSEKPEPDKPLIYLLRRPRDKVTAHYVALLDWLKQTRKLCVWESLDQGDPLIMRLREKWALDYPHSIFITFCSEDSEFYCETSHQMLASWSRYRDSLLTYTTDRRFDFIPPNKNLYKNIRDFDPVDLYSKWGRFF